LSRQPLDLGLMPTWLVAANALALFAAAVALIAGGVHTYRERISRPIWKRGHVLRTPAERAQAGREAATLDGSERREALRCERSVSVEIIAALDLRSSEGAVGRRLIDQRGQTGRAGRPGRTRFAGQPDGTVADDGGRRCRTWHRGARGWVADCRTLLVVTPPSGTVSGDGAVVCGATDAGGGAKAGTYFGAAAPLEMGAEYQLSSLLPGSGTGAQRVRAAMPTAPPSTPSKAPRSLLETSTSRSSPI
jgi:hypothetical protein